MIRSKAVSESPPVLYARLPVAKTAGRAAALQAGDASRVAPTLLPTLEPASPAEPPPLSRRLRSSAPLNGEAVLLPLRLWLPPPALPAAGGMAGCMVAAGMVAAGPASSEGGGLVVVPGSPCASGAAVVADDCTDVALAKDGERDDTAETVLSEFLSASPGTLRAPGGTTPLLRSCTLAAVQSVDELSDTRRFSCVRPEVNDPVPSASSTTMAGAEFLRTSVASRLSSALALAAPAEAVRGRAGSARGGDIDFARNPLSSEGISFRKLLGGDREGDLDLLEEKRPDRARKLPRDVEELRLRARCGSGVISWPDPPREPRPLESTTKPPMQQARPPPF